MRSVPRVSLRRILCDVQQFLVAGVLDSVMVDAAVTWKADFNIVSEVTHDMSRTVSKVLASHPETGHPAVHAEKVLGSVILFGAFMC